MSRYAPPRPLNVIIITSDEMRADCVGFMGSQEAQTPNLDAFARRAVTFENHFCNFPKCVPSRISLFTGRRPHTDGFRDIFNHLPPGAPDLKEWLRGNGYQTVLFGKSHCWGGSNFDTFIDLHSWSPAMMEFWERRVPETVKWNDYGLPLQTDSSRVGCSSGENNDEIYIKQAKHYLTELRNFANPFLMVLNLEKPHPVYAVSEPYYSRFTKASLPQFPRDLPDGAPLSLRAQQEVRGDHLSDENLRDMQAVYRGMISKTDHLIGDLFDCFEELDLWSNSIVLFVSDHGDWAGQFRLPEKWDTSFNDCLTRVPFILHAPGLPKGLRVSSITEMVDITPTIFRLLGAQPDWNVHGTDLNEVIAGKLTKRAAFCDGGHEQSARIRFRDQHGDTPVRRNGMILDKQETYRRYPDSMARSRMIRSLQHKMVIRETGDHELYDMQADPWELSNLWGHPGTEAIIRDLQLQMLIEDLRCDTDRPFMAQVGA